jgi:large subunit ribosomal protein L3
MVLKLMGKKRGMTQLFDDKGNKVVCTVIEVEANVITQVKTKETDGYNAVQTGFEKVSAKDPRRQEARVSKPLRGHFKKGNVEARRHLVETRVDTVEGYELGTEYGLETLEKIKLVDVTGTSKGKGYQGLIKKNNYSGGPGSHGSGFHRHAGSTGMRSTPGRCLAGGPRPSQMGNERVKIESLKIFKIDTDKNMLIVQGSIPGCNGSLVWVSESTKKPSTAKVA